MLRARVGCRGNSFRKSFNLRDIGERGEEFGPVIVGDALEAAVGLEEAELAEGGVVGPFPAEVVAVDLFQSGFVLRSGVEATEGGFRLLAFFHLPGSGDQAAESEIFEGAVGEDFVS